MLKKRSLALICGVIFSFGFAPFDLWLISVLSVAVLVGLLNKSSNKEAFLLGYTFGFGMWLSGISWLYVSIHYHGNIGIIGSSLIILIFISILSLYSGFLFLLNNVLESLSPKKNNFSHSTNCMDPFGVPQILPLHRFSMVDFWHNVGRYLYRWLHTNYWCSR